ncbi:E3 ubiquitin-protein ligase UBR2-like isoform X1 [Styela clava]
MLQSLTSDEKFSRYLATDNNSFEEEFRLYLRDEIVKIIRTDGSWSVGSILHQDVAKGLLNNIIWWLFNDDPEQTLLHLEELNNPQHICGRVFKPGEPTYSCRDCAMDPTCVFCQQCFRMSEHQKHRYKAEMDEGGGMCDCGDTEAFLRHTRCSTHEESYQKSKLAAEDAVSRLPEKVRERAPKFFEVILSYIVEFLTNEKTSISDLDESLQPSEKSDCFVTMLYNDELHTFDFVIDILKRALKCDEAIGSDFATIVDREGRSAVCIDDVNACEEVKKIVGTRPTAYFSFRTNEPLKTLVMHVNIVAHQEMALLLLPWLSRIVKQSEGLRKIFCDVALNEFIKAIPPEVGVSGMISPVERFIRCDHELWKTARNMYLQLLMNSLLLDAETKKKFGILFTRLYEIIQEGFLNGDHEHGHSVASMAVQLYTVPTVTRHLIVHENVIGVILRALAKSCYDGTLLNPDDWCNIMKLNTRRMKWAMRRAHHSFYDLRYILAILPDQMTADLKSKFIDGVKLFVQILMAMQGMDSITRKADRHIEHEPDWETGVNVVIKFNPVIYHLLQWFRTDVDLLFIMLKLCLQALKVLNESDPASLRSGVTVYNNQTYPCLDYDITKQPVSTQYPVTRLMSAIIVELGLAGMTWSDIERNEHIASMLESNSLPPMQLMECSLRCLCLSAQVNAGMWRRNGLSLINQLFYYKDYRCRQEAYERDVQLLQVSAANMDPNNFIVILLNKMKLNPESPEFAEYHIALMSEFFRLLISICGERYTPGVAVASLQEQGKRQIIHILASEPKPHSKISKQLPDSVSDKIPWEEILQEVADFQEPTSISSVGRYVLKPSMLAQFCPYSFHYTTLTDETKAQHEVVRRKKALQMTTVFIPPKLPQFSELFRNIPKLLCCDVFVDLVSKFLQQLTTGDHERWSDRLVEKVLYLISMAIIEHEQQKEMNPENDFDFIKKAVAGCERGILFLLKQLQVTESLLIHRDTVRWLVLKIERHSNQRHGSSSAVDPEHFILSREDSNEERDPTRNARKRKAQELRDKLLTQMKTMQQDFLSQNPDVMSGGSQGESMELSQVSASSQRENETPVCTDLSWQQETLKAMEPSYTCMLCQEEAVAAEGSMVMSALVQRSSVLTRGPHGELNNLDDFAPLFVDLSYQSGIHTSTCSHTMHYECFKQFRDSVNSTEARRRHNSRYSRKGFDIKNNEFLCPLCSRLSNSVIPVIPHPFIAKQRGILTDPLEDEMIDSQPSTSATPSTMREWLKSIEEVLKPLKLEAQEVVLKFHVDVSDMKNEMEKAEAADRLWVNDPASNRFGDEPDMLEPDGGQVPEPQPQVGAIAPLQEESQNEAEEVLEETVQALTQVDAAASADATILLEDQRAALNEFIEQIQVVGLNGDISEVHRPLTSWLSVATTVICSEMVGRLEGTPILAKSPIRISSALSGVIRAAFAMNSTSSEEQLSEVRDHARKLLSALIGEDTDEQSHALLNSNIFSLFVSLLFSSAILRKSKSMQNQPALRDSAEFERNILYLCTLAQIIQIFVFLNVDELEGIVGTGERREEAGAMYLACNQVRANAHLPPLPSNIDEDQLMETVTDCLHPFLRCCALLLFHVTGVPVPDSLETRDNQSSLLQYLGLTKNLTELFDVGGKMSLEPLIQRWCSHSDVIARVASLPYHVLYPVVSQVPDIVPFPHDYSDLIGAAASFKCPKFASEDSLCPTMCLVCGVVLCSQSYCCQQTLPGKDVQVGACTFHTLQCGASTGMFLRVREAAIVLLHGVYRGCFAPAPYLDRHGETDKGLRRGNPLYLNQPRLQELRKLWLSHGIAERVSHDIESRNIGHLVDWAHL